MFIKQKALARLITIIATKTKKHTKHTKQTNKQTKQNKTIFKKIIIKTRQKTKQNLQFHVTRYILL